MVRKTGFLVHSFSDGNENFFSVINVCTDFFTKFAFMEFDIIFGTFVGKRNLQ